jgi:spermidine synthase
VGGLGLGYTAKAVLEHEAVKSLVIVEALDAVDWHERSVLPLGPALTADPRSKFVLGDFFALAALTEGFDPGAPARRFDAILVDIDHSPDFLLDPQNAAFYQPAGLRRLAAHLLPGGVFGLRTTRSHSGLLRSSPWRAPSRWRFTIRFRTGSSPRPFTSRGQTLRRNCTRLIDCRQNIVWTCDA